MGRWYHGCFWSVVILNNFRQLLIRTQARLERADLWFGHGYESAHDEAVALVLAAADLPHTTGAEILEQEVPVAACEQLEHFMDRRIHQREPVAYIIGHAALGPLSFITDSRALVPRSPLMATIQSGFYPWWQGEGPQSIVDVCCGGGSLGLLAAWALPESQVTLLDIDARALSLARENLALHKLTNVQIKEGDLLEPILGSENTDIILANPPYVDALDMASLPDEYHHEPRLALAAGVDGLDLVHRLMAQATSVLSPNGLLFLEVGNSWEALEAAYPCSAFTWLELESGGHGVCVLSRDEISHAIHTKHNGLEKV